MRYFLAICFLVVALYPNFAFSQENKTTISVVDFLIPSVNDIGKQRDLKGIDNPYYTKQQSPEKIHQKISLLPSIVADYFGKDDRFTLVDRKSQALVEQEREYQKTEAFLDGYIVGQGKGIGAAYLVSGEFDMNTNTLNLALYSVAEQNIVGTETVDLHDCLFVIFTTPMREPVLEGVRRLCSRAFPLLMPVVEITEQKKEEARALLVAGGNGRGLRKGTKLDIKVKEIKAIDGGGEQTYYRTIGTGTIEKVEDQNFSILTVESGEKAVKSKLDGGAKLYCTFQL